MSDNKSGNQNSNGNGNPQPSKPGGTPITDRFNPTTPQKVVYDSVDPVRKPKGS